MKNYWLDRSNKAPQAIQNLIYKKISVYIQEIYGDHDQMMPIFYAMKALKRLRNSAPSMFKYHSFSPIMRRIALPKDCSFVMGVWSEDTKPCAEAMWSWLSGNEIQLENRPQGRYTIEYLASSGRDKWRIISSVITDARALALNDLS